RIDSRSPEDRSGSPEDQPPKSGSLTADMHLKMKLVVRRLPTVGIQDREVARASVFNLVTPLDFSHCVGDLRHGLAQVQLYGHHDCLRNIHRIQVRLAAGWRRNGRSSART